jgi:hypothetical protein
MLGAPSRDKGDQQDKARSNRRDRGHHLPRTVVGGPAGHGWTSNWAIIRMSSCSML